MATPGPISRGEYGARVGLRRVLAVLDRHGVPATFFVPGHTAETYPAAVRDIVAAGHEVGVHGYCHERQSSLSPEQEAKLLLRAVAALEANGAGRPVGFRSPAWDLTVHTVELLLDNGFLYDSSLMADDFQPYWCRVGDVPSVDGPFRFGQQVPLVEMPVAWELDDFPYFQFVSHPYYNGTAHPDHAYAIWAAEFDYMVRETPNGVFTLTNHPEIIGRGPRVEMLGRLIAHMRAAPGAQFLRMSDAARRWAAWQGGGPGGV